VFIPGGNCGVPVFPKPVSKTININPERKSRQADLGPGEYRLLIGWHQSHRAKGQI